MPSMGWGKPNALPAAVTWSMSELRTKKKKSTFTELSDTINYVTIFNIVRQRMAVPTTLLEQVAADIIQEIQQQFNIVNEIECSIYKIRAPIENLNGKVGIHLLKKFND